MNQKEIKVTPFYFDNVLQSNHKVVIQVGGRFSAKSYNEHIRLACNLASKKDYKLLVVEDLETGMADGFHAGLRSKIEMFEHTEAYNPKSRTAYIKNLINGNEVLFKGYISEQQRLNVKKLVDITEIIVEEGEWMDYDSFTSLLQQLRGGKEEDRKLTILMNPVNPDCFVNEYFIESVPDLVIERFKDGRPKVFEKNIVTQFEYEGQVISDKITVLVVLSTHYDNPYLTFEQRASIEQLKDTDPDKYKQLGEARFIRPSGRYFKEFNTGIHVISNYVIPNGAKLYASLDYGLDMFACLFVSVDYQGNEIVYKEIHKSDLIISEAAELFKKVKGDDNIVTIYAPSDLWNRRQETGRSVFDIFLANGVILTKSNNDRATGGLNARERLKLVSSRDIETGKEYMTSKLKITANCETLIKHIGQILADDSDANKYASEPHILTHIVDAFRYYCTGRQIAPIKTVQPVFNFEFERRQYNNSNNDTVFGNMDDFINLGG